MILAAGLGTRLRPFTDTRPKALLEVRGKTLLEHAIERAREAGATRIIVNVHHHADQVERFLRQRDFGVDTRVSDERDALRDTGGAIRHARHLFVPALPVLVHNVDVISDVDLVALRRVHEDRHDRATLVVQPPASPRVLRFDDEGRLTGWENRDTGEQKIVNSSFHSSFPFSFCGIQLLSPLFIHSISLQGSFSIIDELLAQALLPTPPRAFLHHGSCTDHGLFIPSTPTV